METVRDAVTTDSRVIQVWFGENIIDSYAAEAEVAERYAELTQRRYAGLRVTIGIDTTSSCPRDLPERRLWPLTVM